MKYLISFFFCALVLLGSCTKPSEERVYTKAEVDKIADSVLSAKLKELALQAEHDFELRKKIELKYRMDSLKNLEKHNN